MLFLPGIVWLLLSKIASAPARCNERMTSCKQKTLPCKFNLLQWRQKCYSVVMTLMRLFDLIILLP